jgi:integrase
LRSLKPKAARYEVIEPGKTGLTVRIAVSGSKTLSYLYRFDGRAKRLTLGIYRDSAVADLASGLSSDPRGIAFVTLADARVRLAEAQRMRSGGIDPSPDAVKRHRAERKAKTVDELADAYLAKYASQKRASSAAADRRILARDIRPAWGRRRVASIERADVVDLLNGIAARGAPVGANRARSLLLAMFRWAVRQGIISTSPATETDRPGGKEAPRARVLSDSEIAEVWRASEPLGHPYGPLVRFMLATGQRRGECAGLCRAELDLASKLWMLPATRTKTNLPHEVPLTPLALEIIKSLPETGEYLFRAEIGGADRPVTGFQRAKNRLDALILDARRQAIQAAGGDPSEAVPMDAWRLHDLRRSMRTGLSALRLDPETCERVIGHIPPGVRRVYDLHAYRREKAEVLAAWSARLRRIVAQKPPTDAKVIKLRGTAE